MEKSMKRTNIFVGIFILIIACFGVFAGCDTKKSIEISAPDGNCQVAPSESITLKAELKGVSAENVTYSITEGGGLAFITNDGKLTANNDATVGGLVKVIAESKTDDIKSNELSITICNKFTTSLKLTADRNSLTAKNNSLQLTPVFDNYVTNKEVTYKIVGDTNFVTVDANGKVSLVTDENLYPETTTTFKISATYVADTSISTEIELTYLLPLDSVKNIVVRDCIIDANNFSSQYVSVVGRGTNGEDYSSIDPAYFAFSSGDSSVATVESDGSIAIHGHGKSEITVTLSDSSNGVSTKFNIYVFATPSAIEFDTNKTNSHINATKSLYFGKSEGLVLGNMLAFSKTGDVNVTQKFKVYVDGVEQTYSETSGLVFSSIGDKVVKVESDPAIDGFTGTIPATLVKPSFTFTAHINNGQNIDTVAEFKAYASQTTNTTANILAKLELTTNNNFGGDSTQGFLGLEFFGNRYINGNGYTLDAQGLPVANAGNPTLLYFRPTTATESNPFTVQIRDFTLLGEATVNGTYVGDNKTSVVNAEGKAQGIYRYGIWVNQEYLKNETKSYVEHFRLENVTIKQFYTALRVCHAVDGFMDNVFIDQCFANGFEMVQNTMEIKDIHIGKVGAFGIEVTSDDIDNTDASNPKGTSGKEFREAQSIKLTGTITSENYNSSTPYLDGLDGAVAQLSKNQVNSISQLINAITLGTIQAYTNGDTNKQTNMTEFFNKLTQNDLGNMNYFMLVFVNPSDFPSYTKGNTEGVFAEYPEISNMAKITEVLGAYANQPDDYQGYKQYQYLLMDLAATLDVEGTQVTMNIGQIVLVNEAYDPTYVAQ